MGNPTKVLAVSALLVLAVANAAPKAKGAGDEPGSLVIVFIDGRHETIRLADVARIEFTAPAATTPMVGAAHFLGEWRVGMGQGTSRTFLITLKPEGVARKDFGSPAGTWMVVNGEAHITWEDGWRDAIRKVGNKYQKAAFSPGHTFSDEPSNVAEATYTEAH